MYTQNIKNLLVLLKVSNVVLFFIGVICSRSDWNQKYFIKKSLDGKKLLLRYVSFEPSLAIYKLKVRNAFHSSLLKQFTWDLLAI